MKSSPVLAIFALCLAGCQGDAPLVDQYGRPTLPHTKVTIMQPMPGVRFTPTSDGELAYDGQTGQLCRTRPVEYGKEADEPLCRNVLSDYPTPKPDPTGPKHD